ncbi:hypothetical protein ABZ864_47730 [Streptomyces sp. NPDC047082]|uniref:hypothetical protein n=1 Tax=Streptomyces sp. NPDC047082 TaxID=3155259 RepID=UPI00340F12D6
MNDLVRADIRRLEAAAEADTWANGRPRDPEAAKAFDRLNPLAKRLERNRIQDLKADALDSHAYLRKRLEDLNARHALLMHGAVLDDAEQDAKRAHHQAVVAASTATLSPASNEPSTWDTEHDAFMEQVTAAEKAIGEVLDEQRQLTRDALHRLFPKAVGGSWAMYQLRTRLVDGSGLGIDHDFDASRAVTAAHRTHGDLEGRFKSKHIGFGDLPVTEEEVDAARARVERAETELADLRTSRTFTLRALRAVKTVADRAPTEPGEIAARAQRITALSRKRAQTPVPATARSDARATEQQTVHGQTPHTGPSARPT